MVLLWADGMNVDHEIADAAEDVAGMFDGVCVWNSLQVAFKDLVPEGHEGLLDVGWLFRDLCETPHKSLNCARASRG